MALSIPGLLEYLEKRLGPYRGKGPEYEFYCPFCIDREGDESNHRKLWINVAKGKAYCFRCRYGVNSLARFFRDLNGGALKLVELALIRGEQTPPAGTDLKTAVRTALYADLQDKEKPKVQKMPPEAMSVPKNLDKLAVKRAVNYLKKRGVPQSKWAEYDVHFAPTGRYAQRLVFPVYQNAEQVYFTTRYAGAHERKSLNPENADGFYRRTDCLLNFDNVIGAPVVAVAEGAFSCMAFDSAVALLGKTISERQVWLLEMLAAYGTEEFVVALDADAGRDADDVYRALQGRVPKVTMLSLDKGDPDDRKAELAELLKGRGEPSVATRVRGRIKRA